MNDNNHLPNVLHFYRSVCLFPKLTPEGNRIFCTTTRQSSDDEKYDVMLFCQVSIAILDLQLKLEPMYGNIILYDLKHIRLAQFMAFTPTLTKNLLKCCIVSITVVPIGTFIGRYKSLTYLLFFKKMCGNLPFIRYGNLTCDLP